MTHSVISVTHAKHFVQSDAYQPEINDLFVYFWFYKKELIISLSGCWLFLLLWNHIRWVPLGFFRLGQIHILSTQ